MSPEEVPAVVDGSQFQGVPDLIDPVIDHPWVASHHSPSGTMVVNWIVRGSWGDAAVDEMRRCLDAALPGRSRFRVLYLGTFQALVFLGVARPLGSRVVEMRPPLDVDRGVVEETLQRVDWVFDRTVATQNRTTPPAPGPESVLALAQPDDRTRAAFDRAAQDAEGVEVLDVHDEAFSSFPDAVWVKLHQSTVLDVRKRLYSYRSRI